MPDDVIMDTLHHVAVVVNDIDDALDWYRAHFAVDIVYADASWALLRFDNVGLALVLPDQHPPHFAVERADAAEFGPLTPHRDGTASVYTEDPAGNAVEILEPADARHRRR